MWSWDGWARGFSTKTDASWCPVFPTGGVSLQGDGERTGPTWAYSPDPRSQVRRPPREPWLLFLQKPKGMRLGPCWAPARHASRLASSPGGGPGAGPGPSQGSGYLKPQRPRGESPQRNLMAKVMFSRQLSPGSDTAPGHRGSATGIVLSTWGDSVNAGDDPLYSSGAGSASRQEARSVSRRRGAQHV